MSADGSKSKKKQHHRETHDLTDQERIDDYRRNGRESWDAAWSLLHSTDWKVEAGTDLIDGVVYAKTIPKHGKVFMLQGYVDASPEFVFKNSVLTIEESPKWNPMVTDIQTLQVVDECTDVSYNVTADAAGGLVASRDFITVRHWETRDGIIMSAGSATLHPDMPPNKKHIRGENRGGGWIYKPVPDNPNKCIFAWIIDTDIKGWIPQYIVDQTISGTLLQFIRSLRAHVERLKSATSSP